MYLDAILEVAIGLVFSWLVLSLATMQVQEWISTFLAWRARFLEKALLNMLGDETLVERFYAHPLIRSISPPGKKPGEIRRPSYIPAQRFAAAILDVFFSAGQPSLRTTGSLSLQDLRQGLQELRTAYPSLATILDHFFPNLDQRLERGEMNLAQLRGQMESWFDDAMERLSGAYKRHAQQWALIIGMVLAVLFNVDTVNIARQLWREPTLRQVIVQQAAVQSNLDPSTGLSQAREYVETLSIPVGWSVAAPQPDQQCGWQPGQAVYPAVWVGNECRVLSTLPRMDDFWGWLVKLIGIFISGLAAMQGAPFWFDILRRLVNLRGSGPVPAAPPAPPTAEEGKDSKATG